MDTVGVTDYTNYAPPKHFGWKNCPSPTPLKNEIKLWNLHKIGGAHLQYVYNH